MTFFKKYDIIFIESKEKKKIKIKKYLTFPKKYVIIIIEKVKNTKQFKMEKGEHDYGKDNQGYKGYGT